MKHISNKAELEQLLSSNKKVVVDFYADWCGPCKILGPIFEEVSQDNQEWTFVKVNVDQAAELSAEFEIRSIPTVIFFQDGNMTDKRIGFIPKNELKEMLK
ncbi:thioredoxin [Mycoplasma tullyi]|uniref:Thioredoxin n=1 Tax=Mycoplasma tullyi TaxID=1612150 RepID=A0A7D7U5X7_9MOLU|nr:thioredoxin [Mycoplasma tullyi]QMT98468.1 thioredoxin [Mycoplasma tullyi]